MADEITDLEVVQAFAEYEREHRPGVLGSEETPAETLMRKGGRLGSLCEAACDRAVELGSSRLPGTAHHPAHSLREPHDLPKRKPAVASRYARALVAESDLEHFDDGFATFNIVDAGQPVERLVCGEDKLFCLESAIKPVTVKEFTRCAIESADGAEPHGQRI